MTSKKSHSSRHVTPKPHPLPDPPPIPGSLPSGSAAAPVAATAPNETPSSPPDVATSTSATAAVARSKSKAKSTLINLLVALIGGLRANFALTDSFDLPSGTFTVAQMIATITAYLALISDVATTSAAYHQAVQAESAANKSTLTLRSEIKATLQSRLGKSAAALVAYGFTPAKVPVRTTKSKMTAVVKSEATRVARGTKGSKQKAAITGGVTDVVVSPVTNGGVAPVAPVTSAKS